MSMKTSCDRRRFLLAGTALGASWLTVGSSAVASSAEKYPAFVQNEESQAEEDVTPAEDLMREHGALRRILLLYEECTHRLDTGQNIPPNVVADAAGIVRSFVEDYHEKLEEDFLFPRFKKANKLVDLTTVLLDQHRAGRRLTDEMMRLSTAELLKDAPARKKLADVLRAFVRMYEPHAAREDTVLFPVLHDIVDEKDYDRLGDEFEKKEQELFGEKGFEKMIDRIAVMEKELGIYDLAQFTPR